jgi:hypothetical protein
MAKGRKERRMTQTEWIISLDDDLKDYDELFVGNVRDGDRLIRCRDCKFLRFTGTVWKCQNRSVMMLCEPNDYCSRAKRAEK